MTHLRLSVGQAPDFPPEPRARVRQFAGCAIAEVRSGSAADRLRECMLAVPCWLCR